MAVQVRRIAGRTRCAVIVEERLPPFTQVVGAAAVVAGVGAAIEYVLDPDRGGARRARLRGKAVHAAYKLSDAGRVLGRDLSGRGRGVLASARYLVAGRRVEDDVLHERVRAELGRHVSHPHAVDVRLDEGVVVLSGDVLAREDRRARRALRRVPGVTELDARWATYSDTTGVSALQGDGRPREPVPELLQQQWSPTARFLMGSGAVATWVLSRRSPGPLAWTLRGVGAVVGARVVTNLSLKRITGIGAGCRAVDVQGAVCVQASPERVWPVVGDYSVFPMFMPDVREVRRSGDVSGDGRLSHWEISGPGGLPVRFDVEETEREEGRRIAWHTSDGQLVAHTGTLRLDPAGDGRTRVQVQLTYNPVAGAVGHAVAALFGANPRRRLHDDLRRLKAVLEAEVLEAR